MSRPEQVGAILKDLLKDLGIDKKITEEQAVVYWEEMVGKEIAARTKAQKIKNGHLFVEVASSAWMHELLFLKPKIMKRLNEKIGKNMVQDIHFRLRR